MTYAPTSCAVNPVGRPPPDGYIGRRERKSHIWRREAGEHYVEPFWISKRLFDEEPFTGTIWDPACGLGRIVRSAIDAHFPVMASDIVVRPSGDEEIDALKLQTDFFDCGCPVDNVVTNPPFQFVEQFIRQALELAVRKVAVVFPTARLNAAHWLKGTPLRRVWLLSPRPSMPPGHIVEAGGKPRGGRCDFCWLVFERDCTGPAELRWLYRDAQHGESK